MLYAATKAIGPKQLMEDEARVKKNATPTEEQILFPVINELYQILKVPVRGKINQFFIETF